MVNIKEVKELIEIIRGTDVVEVEVERSGLRVRVRREASAAVPPAPFAALAAPLPIPAASAPLAPPPAPPAPSAIPDNIALVSAPLVGRFYRAPGPDSPPYVEVGDSVKQGQVVCVIEAMKLMNEIEAEHAGTIRAILVENGRPVEYGEPLFEIERAD